MIKNTILITGGAGFIGSAMVTKLIADSENFVVAIDNLLTGHRTKLPPEQDNFVFIEGDVNDRSIVAEIMSAYTFNYIFHYAAVVGVQRTLANPLLVLHDIEGIRHLLELAPKEPLKRFFFSSSSEIYGDPVESPQHEINTPLNTKLPYAIVKNVCEAFVRAYHQEHGVEYTIFRFFNTYGPKQSKDFVISRFLIKALNNEDISIYGDGLQTRTFCYVTDNIEVCTNAMLENKMINQVVNVGGDKEITIFELAKIIIEITGSSSKIVHLPELEEGDMKRRKPAVSEMRKLMKCDLIPLEVGLEKILQQGLFELTL